MNWLLIFWLFIGGCLIAMGIDIAAEIYRDSPYRGWRRVVDSIPIALGGTLLFAPFVVIWFWRRILGFDKDKHESW